MTYANLTLVSFLSGELSPKLRGRYDLPIFNKGCERLQNFIADIEGQARFRPGFQYINHTRRNSAAVFIPFQFNVTQAYQIEATNGYFRFYKNNGVITLSPQTIVSMTNANPGVFTVTAHGMSNGDEIFVSGISGLPAASFLVASAGTNTFSLTDQLGNNINTSSIPAYSSGGTIQKIYELVTPYVTADLPYLQYSEDADTMYITNNNYDIRKLTRTSDTNWSIGTFSRTSDPFSTSNDWPACVRFYEGRIWYGNTKNNPIKLIGSCGPDATGAPRYDNFTVNTTPLPNDAVLFTMAQSNGQVDNIQWISGTSDFLTIGCFGSVAQAYGSAIGEAITPTSITIKPMASQGCYQTLPYTDGQIVFFIHRSQQFLKSVQFNFLQNNYVPTDRSDTADHLLLAGVKQMVYQSGRPDCIWLVRNDGVLLGLSYKNGDPSPGWHQHKIGGGGLVQWLGVMPRANNTDQLWAIIQRTINGVTIYSIEVMSDEVRFPDRLSFYTGESNKAVDDISYANAIYELQKTYNFLDMSLTYDGSAAGLAGSITITPAVGATIQGQTNIVFTASSAFFTSAMVGRQIWKKYVMNTGGGRAQITGFTDSTHVTCTIIDAFDSIVTIPAGSWYLTAITISGLDYLNNQTVQVVTDGAVASPAQVFNGSITLANPASICTVGYSYQGILKTMNLEIGGIGGPAQTKNRNIVKVNIKLLDSLGISFGTNIYNMTEMQMRSASDILDRPIPVRNGVFPQMYEDKWQTEKHIIIIQNYPLPANIQGIDVFGETVNE